MHDKLFRKGLVIGILCFLLLVILPIVSGDTIVYPREDGPYTVFIGGTCIGGRIPDIFIWSPGYGFQFGPLGFYYYPHGPWYKMAKWSIFIVNGTLQNHEYPAKICLRGWQGIGVARGIWHFKTIFSGRIRVFGVCEEIWYIIE